MRVVNLVLISSLVVTAEGSLAQQRPLVLKGERIRLSGCAVDTRDLSICRDRIIGTVVTQKPDSLILRGEGSTGALAISVGSIQCLNVSNGRKRRTVVGALVGGGAGLLVGWTVGTAEAEQCRSAGDWFCDLQKPGWGGIGLLAGGVVGGAVGYFIKTERWEEVPLDRVRVQPLVTADGRFGFATSVRF